MIDTKKTAKSLVELKDYLTMVTAVRSRMPKPDNFTFSGTEDFVLTNGRPWTTQRRPTSVRQMTMNHCFDNAYRLAASSRGRLRYVEGFATSVIPMHHGWCVDREDKVVDPTWAYDKSASYFGVVFPLASVKSARTGGNASVLDDFRNDFPALRGLVDFEKSLV